ncbi:hypothetical protein HWI79_1407 [Cryptosporidium felis]|nr:hypothetical protein HWI79_1407 [Cryptosporidium felis]
MEIYASKSSEIGKRVNFGWANRDQISEIKSMEDVSMLREVYYEIADFVEKLAKSNEVMEDYKYDSDISVAIDENKEIIRKKKEIIELIETRLRQLNRGDIIDSLREESKKKDENASGKVEYL